MLQLVEKITNPVDKGEIIKMAVDGQDEETVLIYDASVNGKDEETTIDESKVKTVDDDGTVVK